jgi:dihydroorotase
MTMVHDGAIDLPTLIARLTSGPAQAWGLERRTGVDGIGTLAPGAPGDIALLDPDAEWTVDPADFASLGKNTPLTGRTLRGRVVATVFAGSAVHSLEGVGAL